MIHLKRFSSHARSQLDEFLSSQINKSKETGTYKRERIISTLQDVEIRLENNKKLINFCANNYLGFSGNQFINQKSKDISTHFGHGLSSVRFICGTQTIHKELELKISEFHEKEDAITYISCFDANAGIFEAIFNENDMIISDQLNHASLIDGIRLCKAKKAVYKHRDMNDLENILKSSMLDQIRQKIIVTDGVFSMDGNVAPLPKIVELANTYNALTFIDECHATGFFGPNGKGTEEYFNIKGSIDIINSTLGKAMGGAAGGYTTSSKIVVDWLRQKSRPYLFSNSIPSPIIGAAIAAFEYFEKNGSFLLRKLDENTKKFREGMKKSGFMVLGDDHPICPILLKDELLAIQMADALLEKGIYVIGFTFPVVPKGLARIRCQISAGHSKEQIEHCIESFKQVGKQFQII